MMNSGDQKIWGPAKEYVQKDPMIKDKLAFEIIGKLDHDFERMSRSYDEHFQINWAIRGKQVPLG